MIIEEVALWYLFLVICPLSFAAVRRLKILMQKTQDKGPMTSFRNHLKSSIVSQVAITKGATDGANEEGGGAAADDLASG